MYPKIALCHLWADRGRIEGRRAGDAEANDGDVIEVERRLVRHSVTIADLINAIVVDDVTSSAETVSIPIDINGAMLKQICGFHVLEWAEHHKDDKPAAEGSESKSDVIGWDKTFFEQMDHKTLYDLILAANYLNMKPLLKGACKTVSYMIRGKSTAEIRKKFGVVSNFSAAEEAKIKKENAWCRR